MTGNHPGQRLRPASHRWPILVVLGWRQVGFPASCRHHPARQPGQAETAAEGDADRRFAKTRRADGLIARSAPLGPAAPLPEGPGPRVPRLVPAALPASGGGLWALIIPIG
jgi:hypothetical protein